MELNRYKALKAQNKTKINKRYVTYLKLNEIDYASLAFGGDDERKFFES